VNDALGDAAAIKKIKIKKNSALGVSKKNQNEHWGHVPLTIEVLQLLDEVEVLQEDGAVRAGRHRVLVVGDGDARGRGQLLRCCPRKK